MQSLRCCERTVESCPRVICLHDFLLPSDAESFSIFKASCTCIFVLQTHCLYSSWMCKIDSLLYSCIVVFVEEEYPSIMQEIASCRTVHHRRHFSARLTIAACCYASQIFVLLYPTCRAWIGGTSEPQPLHHDRRLSGSIQDPYIIIYHRSPQRASIDIAPCGYQVWLIRCFPNHRPRAVAFLSPVKKHLRALDT